MAVVEDFDVAGFVSQHVGHIGDIALGIVVWLPAPFKVT
jgi:hypothetical protein